MSVERDEGVVSGVERLEIFNQYDDDGAALDGDEFRAMMALTQRRNELQLDLVDGVDAAA